MDFKMIFRYQLSGTVFIIWLLMFNLSVTSASFQDMFTKISSFELSNIFTAVAVGIPIGTIIHQLSIFLKNCIFGRSFGLPYFIDSMSDDARLTDCIARKYKDLDASIVNDKITSTHKKMSDLNTFYYLRFDNGLIAPLLAYIIFTINQSLANDMLSQGLRFCVLLIILVFLLFLLLIKIRSKNESICSGIKSIWSGIKLIWSGIKLIWSKIWIVILLFIVAFVYLVCTANFGGSFFANQNKSYIHVENYTTINSTSESIIGSYVSSAPINSISSVFVGADCKQINYITYGFQCVNSYKTCINFCQNSIEELRLPTGTISKIITSNKSQKIVQTPIDNRLQLITEIAAVIYMIVMVIYIPVLYNQRKECWEYYFGVFNQYFVDEKLTIKTHMFNEYQRSGSVTYIDFSIQYAGSDPNIDDMIKKISQKYNIPGFNVDNIANELGKEFVTQKTIIKNILTIIKSQAEIFNRK